MKQSIDLCLKECYNMFIMNEYERLDAAKPETLQSIVSAAHAFLEQDGFVLTERTAAVPEYLHTDYDLESVRVKRADSFEASLCYIKHPDTDDLIFRYETYHIFDNGNVKHYSVSTELTVEEKTAYADFQQAYAVWEDELSWLADQGILSPENENERLRGIVEDVSSIIGRSRNAQQLLSVAYTEEEKDSATKLIKSLSQEMQDMRDTVKSDRHNTNDFSDDLISYERTFARLIEAWGQEIAAKADAYERANSFGQAQAEAIGRIDGSNLTEAEAWGLLRILDKVAFF